MPVPTKLSPNTLKKDSVVRLKCKYREIEEGATGTVQEVSSGKKCFVLFNLGKSGELNPPSAHVWIDKTFLEPY